MLGGSDLIAFVSTTNRARAAAFYGETLGLELIEESPFALVYDAHGTMLRVTIVDALEPAPQTVLGWAVPDIVAATDQLPVDFIHYDGMDQDERGIWTSPSGARVAWFRDPDGNLLSLTQF
jgi:catechol 2,3-dioxygenase-like lactoylglutathione lyase family enzyme